MTVPTPGLSDSFLPNQLAVDLQHVDLVAKRLRELGVKCDGAASDDARDERLGLALLTGMTKLDHTPLIDLDPVLSELRRQFSAEFGGWVPPIGKNRRTSGILGFGGQPQSMLAAEDPIPTDAAPTVTAPPDAGRGVRVGLLDTRLFPHPFLDGRFDADDDAVLRQSTSGLTRAQGHATFVASLILAQAPAAKLIVRAVPGTSEGKATAWGTARKMMTFLDAGVDVLNLSFGCRTFDGDPPFILSRAIERLTQHMVVVAAAGNHGNWRPMGDGITHRTPSWPAAFPGVVAVGATFADEYVAQFTPVLPWVMALARGVDVTGAFLHGEVELSTGEQRKFDRFAIWSGTSFSAATASGAIAAGTRPGTVTARAALRELLGGPDPVVVRLPHPS